MNCPFCKCPVEDGASFCEQCGADLSDVTSPPDETSSELASESLSGAGAANAAKATVAIVSTETILFIA